MSSWPLLIFLTFCVAVKSEAQLDDSAYSRYSEFAASTCKSREFRCKNGQCISSDLVCDGAANCRDGSDETAAECDRSDLAPCGPRAYRCKYGACVDGDARCNSVVDCVDGSDEAACSGKNAGSSAGCRNDQFKCDSGQCVARTALCDGRVDCRDRSDESLDHCRDFECPDYAFQCRYGGCIDRDLKCNDQINCADGSDEDYELCGKGAPTVVSGGSFRPNRPNNNNNSNNSNGTRQPTTRPAPATKEACSLPSQPDNGEWRLDRSLCPNRRPCFPESGVRELAPGTQLVYTCADGFKVNGTKDVFCGLQGKWSAIPKCVEIKCPALSSAAVEAKCTSDNGWVSCESPTPVKTVAQISCRNSYVPDATDLTRRDNVKCNAKGEWEPSPIKCVSVCGVASTGTVAPLIVNGTRAKIGEFPWHATLYRLKNNEKQFICGATIIRENLLVTAAHCVYDEVTKRVDTPSKYYVAAGNIFRDYDYELHDQRVVKKAQVKDIFIVCNYLGLEGNYASDMAVLQIVKPFTFSSVIMPVCLDVGAVGDQAALEAGNLGRVAGFGRTATGDSSFILQTLTVPYVSLNTCKSSSIASASVRYITMDKFCAGYHNGSAVCDGDSGGGLVFQTDNKWYLRGIVSVGIGTTNVGAVRTCNSYSYSLYTRVSSHMDWIQDIILRVDTNRPTRPCT